MCSEQRVIETQIPLSAAHTFVLMEDTANLSHSSSQNYSTKLKSESSRSKGPYICFVVFFHFATEETKTQHETLVGCLTCITPNKANVFSPLPNKHVLHKI